MGEVEFSAQGGAAGREAIRPALVSSSRVIFLPMNYNILSKRCFLIKITTLYRYFNHL